MPSNATLVEGRIQDALGYLQENPEASISQVARDFHVPRTRLYARSRGIPSKVGHLLTNIRFTDAEEIALCRYIDRLDMVNLIVRKEFIRDIVDYILQKRALDKAEATKVGVNWVSRFIKRKGYNCVP